MLSDLSLHCQDGSLTIKDFTITGNINLHRNDIQTNKAITEFLDGKTPNDLNPDRFGPMSEPNPREIMLPFKDFMTPVMDEIPGIFWPVILPIALISYFYQKRVMVQFKEDNIEYFI